MDQRLPITKRSRLRAAQLTLLTFVAVLAAITVVGGAVVPFLLEKVEKRYTLLQADVNERQARSLARFATLRQEEGANLETVQAELQALLLGAEMERGYSCVVDRDTAEFLCHPMTSAIGMPISSKAAVFKRLFPSTSPADCEPWEKAITKGYIGEGLLVYEDGAEEIVHMLGIPGTGWTVSTHENKALVQAELANLRRSMIFASMAIGLLLAIPSSLAARAVAKRHEKSLESEQARSEKLLLNILPEAVAGKLLDNEGIIAQHHDCVTVLFADLVGFTPWAASISPEKLVSSLDLIFSAFDDLCQEYCLEKIKTLGDAYMLCGGLDSEPAESAINVVKCAERMIGIVRDFSEKVNHELILRVGIHSGELVAGVIGKRKFSYDVWGDTVNTASRIESYGIPNRIQVSETTRDLVAGAFATDARGIMKVKGIGDTPLWLIRSDPARREQRSEPISPA